MAGLAAHLTDRVLPRVPIRQWVLTLPFRLRFMLAHDPELTSLVLGLFLSELFRWMKKRVVAPRGQAGAVTLIQRFGGALNLNPHFHSLVPDGVYHRPAPDGRLEFLPLPSPTASEIDVLTARIADRILTDLRARGLLEDEAAECPVDGEATLAFCAGASVQGVIAFGDQPGARVERAGQAEEGPGHSRHEVHGFSLHASEPVPAEDRERLERLIRYTARPPVPDERVSLRRDGAVQLALRRPWGDGTTHLLFQPIELLEKLAALVPRPHANLIRYHGFLAPAATWRSEIVPAPPVPAAPPPPDPPSALPWDPDYDPAAQPLAKVLRWIPWAVLLKRALHLDGLECEKCGRQMEIISFITDPPVVKGILDRLGLPSDPPPQAPAAVQLELYPE